MVVIVMGVSGCGKTTVGTLLAGKLGVPFHDADAYHPASNVELMKAGIPLNDENRRPWLEVLAENIAVWNCSGGAVLACSALKKSYRSILSRDDKDAVRFLHLTGTKEQVAQRMQERSGHFMPLSLLESQFATLEPPGDALVYSISLTSPEIADDAAGKLKDYYAAV